MISKLRKTVNVIVLGYFLFKKRIFLEDFIKCMEIINLLSYRIIALFSIEKLC